MSRLLKSVRTKLVEAFEDRITRPVFFLVVLPPLVVWDWWKRYKGKKETSVMGMKEPKTLEEALVWLVEWFHCDELSTFRATPEESLARFHHNVGRQIRNGLRLWDDPKPALWHYFVNELKIDHPDDMSGLLLTSFHRHLNGRPLDIEAQVCKYHEYWACFAGNVKGFDIPGPN